MAAVNTSAPSRSEEGLLTWAEWGNGVDKQGSLQKTTFVRESNKQDGRGAAPPQSHVEVHQGSCTTSRSFKRNSLAYKNTGDRSHMCSYLVL